MERHRLSSAIVLSIAIVVSGIMLPVAVKNYRAFERTITVKGLCEREVEADKVVWPINYKVASDNLNELTAKMESSRKAIVQFLKDGGIDESEITFSAPIVSDKYSQEYGGDNRRFRYISQNVITVCTNKVEKIQPLTAQVQELLKAGVVVSRENYWESGIQYLFEGLNDIKPEMIHEAMANVGSHGKDDIWHDVIFNEQGGNAVKNEIDLVVNDRQRLLLIECKSGEITSADIFKIDSVRRTYGGNNSKALLISYLPVASSLLEKCKDLGIYCFAPEDMAARTWHVKSLPQWLDTIVQMHEL